MNAVVQTVTPLTPANTIARRVKRLDWERLSQVLDTQGNAVLERLLAPDECQALAGLYPQDDLFRSRVVMGRHGFGRGAYKYFRYPSVVYPGTAWREQARGAFSLVCERVAQDRSLLCSAGGWGMIALRHGTRYGNHVCCVRGGKLCAESCFWENGAWNFESFRIQHQARGK